MKPDDLRTDQMNTWCPGCHNNVLLHAFRSAASDLINSKEIKKKNIVAVSDIGCAGKIFDLVDVNAFYALHGRVLPVALGIKTANPHLTVVGFGGDGGTYSEGLTHFIHACRYNQDMTMIVSNNGNFALTKGQASPTSRESQGVIGKEKIFHYNSLNPILLALSGGAGFVARGCTLDMNQLTSIMKAAIRHKGFAFIDILQPCLIFHKDDGFLRERIYKLEEDKNFISGDLKSAMLKAGEWDGFSEKSKIPIGVFYEARS